jgi:hypothetical protein
MKQTLKIPLERTPEQYDLEEEEWDDSDEGPTWLEMDDLPYRGGGVMARQRPRGGVSATANRPSTK